MASYILSPAYLIDLVAPLKCSRFTMEDRLAARRQAEQDRLREKRNFRHWESQATDEVVLKPIKPKTENGYNRMLDAWDK